ncbi:MAG: S8 family peptidase [Salinivirgaceae bacterium]|nr:S8 family peptidase [Salinivirgaceae bacterium]
MAKQIFHSETTLAATVRIIAMSIAGVLCATGLQAQEANYRPDIIVVKYSNAKAAADRTAQFENLCHAKALRANRMFATSKKDNSSAELSRIYLIEYKGNESPAVIARKLAQSEDVEYAEPYWIPELLGTPNDPSLSRQYFMSITQTLEAHDITQGDTNIVIGIVDTGVDVYHEDLADNIKLNHSDPINGFDDDNDGYIDNYRGWDLGENDNNPISSANHHGSNVAGMACATTNNGIGVASVGYKTKFLPIKAANEDGTLIACYEGIVYAADHGCQIINCSWGSTAKSLLCDDVIKYAQSRGCLVIAAAGNTGTDIRYYPASCDGVFSVCASNSTDTKWKSSSYNTLVDIAAPGENVFTATSGNNYQNSNGTSFAAPLVSGAAALVWAVKPTLTAVQVAELLRVTADNIDTIPANAKYAGKMGSGRINVLRALTDSTSPSLRITKCRFSGDERDFVSGETVEIGLTVCNYLKKAKNVTITLDSPDNSITVLNGTWGTTQIDEMQSIDNPTFTATIADNLGNNATVPLRFKFEADGYSASQIVELTVNPSFRDVEWGQMQTTIADNGKIGIYDYEAQKGNGFIYQKKQNLFSDGALIFAFDNSKIASAFQTDNQFSATTGRPTIQVIDGATHIKSAIKPNNIYGIEILQDFIFDSQNLPTAMICDYSIVCSRNDGSPNAAIGLYFDWDVVNSLTNQIDYDATRKLAYIYNTGNIGLYGGICLISDGQATPYAFEISEKGSSINIKDDFTDEQKWITMNQSRPKSTSTNIDLALMLSNNQLTINPKDTTRVTFAVLAAENLYELNRAADLVKKLYTKRESTVIDDDTTSITSQRQTTALIYPNPVKSTIYIENDSPISTVRIYSTSGVLEAETNVGGTSAAIGVSQLADGLHIVEIISTDGRTERRLVVK